MQEKEILIKVKDFQESTVELDFLLQELRDFFGKLQENKEFWNNVNKLREITQNIQKMQEIKDKIEQVEENVFLGAAKTDQSLKELDKKFKQLEAKLTTWEDLIEQQSKKVNKILTGNYNKILKNIKEGLLEIVTELQGELQKTKIFVDKLVEDEYIADLNKLNKKQRTLNFLIFILILTNIFFGVILLKQSKLINNIQNITYTNYQILNSN